MTEQQFRIEHDTMGEVKVPVDALWRAQTQRAVENFPISGRPLESAQIRAMGLLKAACAIVNKDRGLLAAEQADAIVAAAKEIAEGKHDAEFPIDVFQTGSGTSLQYEHQRGHRLHRQGTTAWRSTPMTTSIWGSPPTTPSPPQLTWPPPKPPLTDLIPGLKVLHDSLADEGQPSGRTWSSPAVPTSWTPSR